MSGIWRNDGKDWQLLSPQGFPDEATLHSLIEKAPQLLPLAGSPGLVVVGSEVQLGTGYADLVAIEPSGRLAIIEIKLAKNAEARRAVISQVLAYAAYLYRLDVPALERDILGKHLAKRGHSSLGAAVAGVNQEGSFDNHELRSGQGPDLGPTAGGS